jgi:hypothetical protein
MKYSIVLMVFLFSSCQPDQQGAAEQVSNLQAIKNILDTERRAHFEKNVGLLIPNGADDSVLSINRGSVSYASAEKSRARFQEYFNAVEFIKWDDMRDPIFNFSNDSSLAAVTVQKLVVLREKATEKIDTTQFAWTAVYRKINNEWKMTVMTSTNK